MTSQTWDHRLNSAYREPHRHYHTLHHVETMLNLLDRYKLHIHDEKALGLAIWFHDAVYDPKRADNEDESIEMFKRFAADVALEESVRTRVIDMIAATKHHDLGTLEEEKDKKEDLCFFLDFDLQILGDKSETYDRYAADIRKEYIFYDDASYKQGRLLVLHGFLGKSHIFHTQVFRDLYENAARRNIKREIASIASADTSRSLEAIPTDLSDV